MNPDPSPSIDVMVDSELWSATNLIITPHVAGNRPQGSSAMVLANLAAMQEGRELTNQVA